MLTPPILAATSDDAYVIVCGFARLQVWRELGRESVVARVLPPDSDPLALLLLAVEENMAGRGLNVVEQALALEKAGRYLPRDKVIAEALPVLGLKPAAAILDRLLPLRALHPQAQEAIALGHVPDGIAPILAMFEPEDQRTLTACTVALRMSVGACRDLARETLEVCRREGLTAAALLRKVGFDPAAPLEPAAIPPARARVLEAIHKLRFPILSGLQESYAATHKALGFGGDVTLRPPKDFEGDRYVLEAHLRSVEDLERAVKLLQENLQKRRDGLESLFDVRWDG